jgi:riboflavin synthase alpha subunit
MGIRKPGDKVNVESDMMAKYIERILSARGAMAAAAS